MNWKRIATAPWRGLKQLTSMVFSRSSGLVWRFLPGTRHDYDREVGDRMGSSVIMAPLLWMARNFPEAPLIVTDADGTPDEDHQLPRLVRRPNPHYSGIILWMATILSWVVDGNAYWIKIRNRLGAVVELWWVPHWMIEPHADSDTEFVDHYRYTPDGRQVRLDVDDVVHFRYGLDPYNPRKGMSPLNSVLREVFTDDEAANFSASLLRNVGVPGLIVAPKGDNSLTKDEADANKAYMEEQFSGDNRGKPLVNRGPTEVHEFGFSPEQMTLRELRRIPEERVSGVLGVAAIVAGLGAGLDRSTFANFKEAREAAYEENLIPTQRMFAEEIRHQLLPDFDEPPVTSEVAFDLSNVRILQADRNSEAERIETLYKGGIVTRAEARQEQGLDTSPADDVYAVPINTLLVPREQAPQPVETRGRKQAQEPSGALRLVQQLERTGQHLSGIWADELEVVFGRLGEQVADAYLTVGTSGRNGHSKQDDVDPAEVERILAAAGLSTFAGQTLTDEFERHWTRVVSSTVDTIDTILTLGVDLADDRQVALIRQGGRRAGLVDLDGDTRAALFRALSEARERGLGADATGRLIRTYVPEGRYHNAGAGYRARLISRTETKFAQNVSSLSYYRETPGLVGLRAYDARLGDTDEDCLMRNGQTFDVGDADRITQEEHPQGTLSWAPVIDEARAVEEQLEEVAA